MQTDSSPIRISVIIPNYNHALYLKERVDSVLAQTRQDFEVIILDDCSKDNSREVIESYRHHPRVSHIVCNAQNTGSPFKQWQKGFALAQGEYIWIAESDDVADPRFLETCASVLDQRPEVVLAYSDCRYIDSRSQFMKRSNLPKYLGCKNKPGKQFSSEEFIRKKIIRRNCVVNASMALFRKSALPHDLHYTHFRYSGDWLFWIEVARQGEVFFVNQPLDHFRQHGENTTKKSEKLGANIEEMVKMYEYLFPQLRLSFSLKLSLLGEIHRAIRKRGLAPERFNSPLLSYHPMLARIRYRIGKILRIDHN